MDGWTGGREEGREGGWDGLPSKLSIDGGTSGLRVFLRLKDEHPRSLGHNEPGSVLVEWLGGLGREEEREGGRGWSGIGVWRRR